MARGTENGGVIGRLIHILAVVCLLAGCAGGGNPGAPPSNTATVNIQLTAASPTMDDGTRYAELDLIATKSGTAKFTADSLAFNTILAVEQAGANRVAQVAAEDDGGSNSASTVTIQAGLHYTMIATSDSGNPLGLVTLGYRSDLLSLAAQPGGAPASELLNTSAAGSHPVPPPSATESFGQSRGALNGRQTTPNAMGRNSAFGRTSGNLSLRKSIAPSTRIFGTDLSVYDGTVDFAKLSKAVSFAVIKADEGAPATGQTFAQCADKNFSTYRQQAEQQGMEVGFYHFADAQLNTPDAEAQCFCENVGHLNKGEFAVLDFEQAYTGDSVAWCKAWLDGVQARLGVRPLLYTDFAIINASDWTPVIKANYGLWLANFGVNPNGPPPATPWPSVAMLQYGDTSTFPGIISEADADVFYGSVSQLQSYGAVSSVTPAAVSWTTLPVPALWYRSDEHLVFKVSGSLPNTVQEMIDGKVVSTQSTSGGFIALSSSTPGMHAFEVTALNSANNGKASVTGTWTGGWDPNPPTVVRSGGALPSTWYNAPAASVSFSCSDPLYGIRQSRYQWDSAGFSPWSASSAATVQLIQGQHHLYVEAEDNTYSAAVKLGNQATIDLGEYWLDMKNPRVTLSGKVVASTSSPQVQATVANPNISPVANVGTDLIQLGPSVGKVLPWQIGTIAGQGSSAKVFSFPVGFGANKALLLTANVHLGNVESRHRVRLVHP